MTFQMTVSLKGNKVHKVFFKQNHFNNNSAEFQRERFGNFQKCGMFCKEHVNMAWEYVNCFAYLKYTLNTGVCLRIAHMHTH